jgi:hypothetical protein
LLGEAIRPPPPHTALGGILTHLQRKQPSYQPSNITWACLPPHENPRLKKRDRYAALADRALGALGEWLAAVGVPALQDHPISPASLPAGGAKPHPPGPLPQK